MTTLQSTKEMQHRMLRHNTLDQVREALNWGHIFYIPSQLINALRHRIENPLNFTDPFEKMERHQNCIRALNLLIATEFMIEHDLTEEEFTDPVNQMLFAIQHPEAKV